MATNMKRALISLTPELASGTEELKQTEFYNKSYAELYRHLISLGLQVSSSKEKQVTGKENSA